MCGHPVVHYASFVTHFTFQITQYDCNYDNLAPDGCTQYFWGMTSDIVKTFNFDEGAHLANQNQNICIRQERNTCRICWTPVTAITDFQVSGGADTGKFEQGCCSYGEALSITNVGYDCAKIPGATKKTDSAVLANGVGGFGFCGSRLASAGDGTTTTICCKYFNFGHFRSIRK